MNFNIRFLTVEGISSLFDADDYQITITNSYLKLYEHQDVLEKNTELYEYEDYSVRQIYYRIMNIRWQLNNLCNVYNQSRSV